MLDKIIRFSLGNRFLIVAVALLLVVAGTYRATRLPIDVLPDLNRPRVTVMTECPGLAAEEVESLVTLPLETTLVGTTGVEAIRSSSVVGLSTIVVEFNWSSDLYRSRQVVFERLQECADELPDGITPRMTPVASVMGQILVLAIYAERGETSPMDLRTVADWDVRRKLLAEKGVSSVYSMGGERRQYQILLRPDDLLRFGLTVDDVESAVRRSNRNVTGGFLTEQGPKQFLVRSIGRIKTLDDLKTLVVKNSTEPPVLLEQVADVREGAAVAVGDSSAAVRLPDGGVFEGDAVVLTVEKQPNEDARRLTDDILAETERLQTQLRAKYPDLTIIPLYQQRSFVQLAVDNVLGALRDGAFLVLIVVFLFLASFRTTFITIVTIPTALVTTCLVFAAFGMSVNAMTLGGLAVAIGELVDDAIVDVENIFRRLGENSRLEKPRPTLGVVFAASSEIRRSVVNGTLITVLVFFPLFFLEGIEGKLFAPLGIAYVVSLVSSLLVSLTLTPALSHLLLPRVFNRREKSGRKNSARVDRSPREKKPGVVLRLAHFFAAAAIRFSLRFPGVVLIGAILLGVAGVAVFLGLDRDFMPPFNEGAIQVNLDLTPGTSLETSSEIAARLASELVKIDGIDAVVRKTGRSEMDEHAVPVNTSEFICSVDRSSGRDFNAIVDYDRALIESANFPGTIASYDQPLQHLINHLRSGTRSKIAIKISGDNLAILRSRAKQIKEALEDVDDVGSLRTEPIQADLPQVQIRLKRDALAKYGLTPEDVDRTVEIAMNGSVATTVLEGEKPVEVLTRLNDDYRENIELLRRLAIRLPERTPLNAAEAKSATLKALTNSADPSDASNGDFEPPKIGSIPLSDVAEIDVAAQGPGQIDRENARRQVVIQSNPRRRGAVEVKEDIDERLAEHWDELTADGVDVRVTGLFESEQSASKTLLALSCLTCFGVFLILYRMFRSANLAIQVMAIVPLALVGAVGALWLTGQSRTIPSLIGMISLCGIASRNGILLIEHYLNLVRFEGQKLSKETILQGGLDRTAPVLMTALTSAIGLLPLAASPNLPGREILYPIATVIIGGLLTSTALEFFVRPALFWSFGLDAARRVLNETTSADDEFPSNEEKEEAAERSERSLPIKQTNVD